MLTYFRRAVDGRAFPFVLVLAGTTAFGMGAGAVVATVWNRSEVVPVVLVKLPVAGDPLVIRVPRSWNRPHMVT